MSLPTRPMTEGEWDGLIREQEAGRLAWQAREALKKHATACRLAADRERAIGDPEQRASWFDRQAKASSDGYILNDRTMPGSAMILGPVIDRCGRHHEVLACGGFMGRGYEA